LSQLHINASSTKSITLKVMGQLYLQN